MEQSYRVYLESEFERRRRRNEAYSLRAFARDLEIAPSRLSELLSGKCGISSASAAKLAAKLMLNENERSKFVNLVESAHGRSPLRRTKARESLKSLKAQADYSKIDLEKFKVISDWHHFAILELTELRDFRSSLRWIAERLAIPEDVADVAIQRLLRLKLLSQDKKGNLKQTDAHLATPSGVPSREIREHHSQILLKAERALDRVPVEERECSSTTLAISTEQLGEARELMREFRGRFSELMQKSASKNRVYCLSMQFSPLDQESK